MNFSWTFYHRADRKWGSLLPNGSHDGMVSSLLKGEADLIATSLTMMPHRERSVDFLVPIGDETYAIFIKRAVEEDLDWTVYADPFRLHLWKFLFLYSLACTAVIKALEMAVNRGEECKRAKSTFQALGDLAYMYWVSFRSNLGGPPPPIPGDKKTPLRVALFSIFFVANIVFMCYRASLTSELSTRQPKMPFITLEDLLGSDYQYVYLCRIRLAKFRVLK